MTQGNSFLLLPVFLAIGIAVYFALPVEPPYLFSAFFLALAVSGCAFWRNKWLVMVLLVVAGFVAAQMRTALVDAPMLSKALGPVDVEASIEGVEYLAAGKGVRFLLSDIEIEDLTPERTPHKIRLTYRGKGGGEYVVGDRIAVLAKLNAPSTPVIPGGFDFQRYLYFKGIGAVGFIYHAPEIITQSEGGSVVERARQIVSQRINRAMENKERAGVAIALLTGYRAGITQSDQEAFRAAGLAHLLAISGLHVGLFSGFVFFVVRLLLALIPSFALHHPIKKYAAVVAFIAAVFYMLLAGATVPTQRAVLMTGVFFLAVILDRSPISLRLVAFAAFVVLAMFPEALMSASFHLSFAAVIGLVVFYGRTRGFWMRIYRGSSATQKIALYFFGVCITSAIATICTAPFALYHFHRMAAYGLLANLIAVPLTSIVIMPAALLALLLMPINLERAPLYVMDMGLRGVLDVAHRVEDLPHSVLYVGALGAKPDVLITEDFATFAYRDEEGALHVNGRRKNRFAIEKWENYYGFAEGSSHYWPRESGKASYDGAMRCDEAACRLELKGYKLSFMKNAEDVGEECLWADAVIVKDPVRKAWELCDLDRVVLLHKFDGWDGGTHALYLGDKEGSGITVKTSEELRGMRPWSSNYEASSYKSALD